MCAIAPTLDSCVIAPTRASTPSWSTGRKRGSPTRTVSHAAKGRWWIWNGQGAGAVRASRGRQKGSRVRGKQGPRAKESCISRSPRHSQQSGGGRPAGGRGPGRISAGWGSPRCPARATLAAKRECFGSPPYWRLSVLIRQSCGEFGAPHRQRRVGTKAVGESHRP